MEQHQINTYTEYNRYPNIFNVCRNLKSDTILSFGCASGEEVFSLNEIYFPESEIYGVERNEEALSKCKEKNKYNNIHFYRYIPKIKFDIIFALSVLCRWPDVEDTDDSTGIYGFEYFNSKIIELDSHLKMDGHIVIYNSNFLFCDSSVYNKYVPIKYEFEESGFVHKFDRHNKKIQKIYKDCIFQKKYE
jgi:hypothetical protein